ncbi:MAG: zinc ribbon domain-containing protein [Candidatus Dormibacteria bacterium]
MNTVAFTSNVRDLSTQDGYQFEFMCMRCGNGYRSSFHRSLFGFGGKVLAIGGSLLGQGQIESAGWDATMLRDGTGSPAKDKELGKAAEEVRKLFYQCSRCGKWVCKELCWNDERGMCVDDAPKMGEQLAAMQADAQRQQLEQKLMQEDLTKGINYTQQSTGLCAKCHQESGGGKFCQHCGAPLAAAPDAVKKFCTNCGTELTAGTKFCAECGTPAPA